MKIINLIDQIILVKKYDDIVNKSKNDFKALCRVFRGWMVQVII